MKNALEIFKAVALKVAFQEKRNAHLKLVDEFFEEWSGNVVQFENEDRNIKRFMFAAEGGNKEYGVALKMRENGDLIMGWISHQNDDSPGWYGKTEPVSNEAEAAAIARDTIEEAFEWAVSGLDIRNWWPQQ